MLALAGRAATAVLVVMTVAVMAPAAGADCMGPTLEYEAGPVDRGGTVRVTGTGWGDDCYDTGDPPAGEGILGKPVGDIEIWIVQNGDEHLVAIGDADVSYEFTVDVPVPASLDSGPVEIVPRSRVDGVTLVATTDPVIVSDAAPAESDVEVPVRFGDSPPEQSDATASSSASDESTDGGTGSGISSAAVVVLIAIIGVGVAVGALSFSRQRRR